MKLDKNQQAFLSLVKAGLWGQYVMLSHLGEIDYSRVMQIAEEQSVIGLVTAGLEKVRDVKVPKEILLLYIGSTLQIEQQNKEMNAFVAKLVEILRKEDVYAVLVKGQGIAQCYEKPLWRACGDVDLLLSGSNYDEAKKVLIPQSVEVEEEYKALKHIGMTMQGGFVVELHGSMYSRLSKRVDRQIDAVQKDVFLGGNVRSWQDGRTTVFLPAPDNDVIFVFTHILHHFYIEGIGLRQICDWCRLLWTYRETLNRNLLESRIRETGLVSEWRAFAALAVDWLGMPVHSMPLYSADKKWSRKARRIIAFVLECGNFGHNREYANGKLHSVWLKTKDFARHSLVFPWDSIKFYFHFLGNGIEIMANK